MCSFHVVYYVFFSCCIWCVLFILYIMCSFHVVYYVFFSCCTAFFNKFSSKPRHYHVTVYQHLFLKLGEVILILCFLSLFQLLYNSTVVGYNYSCQTVDYSDQENEVRVSNLQFQLAGPKFTKLFRFRIKIRFKFQNE